MTSKFEKTYKKLKKNFFSVLLLLLLLLANLKQKKRRYSNRLMGKSVSRCGENN